MTAPSYLHNEISPAEVSDGARQTCATPDEPQEERPLCVGERLHHLPEPLDERRRRLHSLVSGHRLQQVERDVRASAHLSREKRFNRHARKHEDKRGQDFFKLCSAHHRFQFVTGEKRQQRNWDHSSHSLAHGGNLLVKFMEPEKVGKER